jgi:ATP-dependent DNA helicase RecQ
MSFERKNLAYVVRKTTDKFTQLTHILTSVSGSAIVYVRSRRRTKEISDYLNEHLSSGTPIATYFHAGLDHSVKDDRQQKWSNDEIRIIVATNAFGMGIDKPNVRLVIHFDCPDSIEAYFQEAGRAGRDGRKAYAVLLYNDNDKRKLEKRISENFPEKDYIKKVYEHLAYFYQMAVGDGYGVTKEFDIDKFCRTFRHFPVQADAALKLLDRSGYIHYETDPDGAPRVMFLLQRDELYRLSETSPHEEAVITSMLRNYGGMFTDYSYIDESSIANETRLTDEQVYLCLKALSKRRILHFIPRSNMPTITYTQRREETEYIVIPKTVYEERKEQFTKRIRAIELYAGNDDVCRSRQLLLYFGEERAHDCGICDVCNQHRDNPSEELDDKRCQQIIMNYLSDGKRHLITELNNLHIPERHLSQALQYLTSEEMVSTESSWIYIEKPNQ